MAQIPKEISINDEGIYCESIDHAELIGWKQMLKIRTLTSYYSFTVHHDRAFILPKRLLSQQQIKMLDGLIAGHCR